MVCLELACWQWTAAVIATATGIYLYCTRHLGYWDSRGVSGPKPLPFFGNHLSTFFKPMAEVEKEWYQKFGKIYGTYSGNRAFLTVADPELIKQIMVKDFNLFRNRRPTVSKHPIFSKIMFLARDDEWKRIRAIASPTFTSGKMKKMYSLIRECVNEFIEELDRNAQLNKGIELKNMHGAYTMDVIAKCAFATSINSHKDPNNLFIYNAKRIFTIPRSVQIIAFILPTFLLRYRIVSTLLIGPLPGDFFVKVIRHLIQERKTKNERHNDFLQLLMDAERDTNESQENDLLDVNEAHHVMEGKDELKAKTDAFSNVMEKKLTENEILAQCFLFFVAAYETTASTLSFCSYELALHHDIQERLYQEIKAAEDINGIINYDVLSKLPYLDAVLSETLRKYPPFIKIERESMSDYKLGDTGITIPKGTIVEVPVFAMHHAAENYENPEEFNPDRFMGENRGNIKPYTYLPFGIGPRNCVGMRFALLEAKLALVMIIQKFKFSRTKETDVPLKFTKGARLLQTERLILGIERRK